MEKQEKDQRERTIQIIADMLRSNAFTFEYRVKKKPAGIKIIYELTQEDMDEMVESAKERATKSV